MNNDNDKIFTLKSSRIILIAIVLSTHILYLKLSNLMRPLYNIICDYLFFFITYLQYKTTRHRDVRLINNHFCLKVDKVVTFNGNYEISFFVVELQADIELMRFISNRFWLLKYLRLNIC